jgi:ketosteroid isomerase-like protein
MISIEEKVQWLVDRAEIHDLIMNFARCADTKDWNGYAALFAEDGAALLPFGRLEKKDLVKSVTPVLAPFALTQHLFTNVSIDVNGDTANTNHYLQAVHVPSSDEQELHADIGGWYNNTYRRTADGWRLVTVDLTFVWSDGIPFQPGKPG